MKLALPENAKIAKEAKECMQECVSEFISFITSEGVSCYACFIYWTPVLIDRSFGKMPTGKAKDSQRRGYLVCDDLTWVRELRRSFEDLSFQVS